MNMQTVTFDADLYKLVPIEPKGEIYEKGFLAQYMRSFYKDMIRNSPPINTEEK